MRPYKRIQARKVEEPRYLSAHQGPSRVTQVNQLLEEAMKAGPDHLVYLLESLGRDVRLAFRPVREKVVAFLVDHDLQGEYLPIEGEEDVDVACAKLAHRINSKEPVDRIEAMNLYYHAKAAEETLEQRFDGIAVLEKALERLPLPEEAPELTARELSPRLIGSRGIRIYGPGRGVLA